MRSPTGLCSIVAPKTQAWPYQPSLTKTTGFAARAKRGRPVVCSPHSDEEGHEAIPLDLVLDELPHGELVPVNRRHGSQRFSFVLRPPSEGVTTLGGATVGTQRSSVSYFSTTWGMRPCCSVRCAHENKSTPGQEDRERKLQDILRDTVLNKGSRQRRTEVTGQRRAGTRRMRPDITATCPLAKQQRSSSRKLSRLETLSRGISTASGSRRR